MKIIHTFSSIHGQDIDKRNLYMMTLSFLLAKKYFGNVVLYTDKKTANIVREIGLEYDEIDDTLLDEFRTKTFSIPKLIVYSVQKEPFLHIDLDTFIFHKIDLEDKGLSFSNYNEGINYVTKIDNSLIGFYNTYLGSTFELIDKLDPNFVKHIYIDDIPNMSIFGGYNYELISKATKYCLDLYDQHKDFFDMKFYNACIIEQLFIPTAMRMFDDTAKFRYFYGNRININFQFSNDINEEYPFYIEVHDKDTKIIKNNVDLFDCIEYDFNGFMHLCGSKKFNKIMYIIRGKIILELGGYNYIKKIDELRKENMGIEFDGSHYSSMKILSNKRKKLI